MLSRVMAALACRIAAFRVVYLERGGAEPCTGYLLDGPTHSFACSQTSNCAPLIRACPRWQHTMFALQDTSGDKCGWGWVTDRHRFRRILNSWHTRYLKLATASFALACGFGCRQEVVASAPGFRACRYCAPTPGVDVADAR